ncbi:beta-lactamase superfamily domain-containing protein [Dipodascopsis uninucleata]
MPSIRTNVSVFVLTLYTLYYGYVVSVRHLKIRRRKELADQSKSEQGLDLLNYAAPEEQYAVMVVGGKFANPFPEYREQSVLEFALCRLLELIRFSPHAGVPRNRSGLEAYLPIYRPDFEILFDMIGLRIGGTINDSNPDFSGHSSPIGLTSSVSSAIYYSSDTGSSTNIPVDSLTLTESWTAIGQRSRDHEISTVGSPTSHTSASPTVDVSNGQTIQSALSSPSVEEERLPDIQNLTKELLLDIPSKENRITVTWIGQSCAFVQCRDINFLTDPVFGNFIFNSIIGPKRLVRSPCSIEQLPRVHFVLVSHNHPDHLEDALIKKIGNSALWIVPLGVRKLLAREGIYRVAEMSWWEKIPLPGKEREGWEVACTPSMHWSGRGVFDSNKSLWCSFVILHNSRPVIFHGGDTGYSSGLFKGIAEVYGTGCEVALIPCGSYKPRWHLRSHHCNPEEAVQIMLDLGARRMIGVHWGTFTLSDEYFLEPKSKLAEAAKAEDLTDFVWCADFGRTVVIPYKPDAENSDTDDLGAFRIHDHTLSNVGKLLPIEGRDTYFWSQTDTISGAL